MNLFCKATVCTSVMTSSVESRRAWESSGCGDTRYRFCVWSVRVRSRQLCAGLESLMSFVVCGLRVVSLARVSIRSFQFSIMAEL